MDFSPVPEAFHGLLDSVSLPSGTLYIQSTDLAEKLLSGLGTAPRYFGELIRGTAGIQTTVVQMKTASKIVKVFCRLFKPSILVETPVLVNLLEFCSGFKTVVNNLDYPAGEDEGCERGHCPDYAASGLLKLRLLGQEYSRDVTCHGLVGTTCTNFDGKN